jgi:threonylcarbamoyladenosine tRNA methylthiotransferase MtaB
MNEYTTFVGEAVRRVPGLCLGTDIMVGFTGESESDFEETCRQFLELPFAYTHVFPFSEREGTVVMKREDGWVPVEERNRRCNTLRRLSAKKRHDFMEVHLGREADVLLEDPRDGGFPGYTPNYIRVRVPDPGHDIRNQLVRVRLGVVRADWMEAEVIPAAQMARGPSRQKETAGPYSGIRV